MASRDPHSIEHAAIGRRLVRVKGRGSDHAVLVWLAVLSHTPYDGAERPTWACTETLALETGLSPRDVQYGLQRLREASMLTTPHGRRHDARGRPARREFGRLLEPKIEGPVKVLIPDRAAMANLWITCREARPRPAALVTAMVGAHVLAAHALDRRPSEWAPVPGPAAELRRFVGASKGSTWGRRVNDLCGLGLLERRDQLWVAPPREWMQGWRAIIRL